ncbi:RNA pseudouridylate synthase domain-containing protein 1 [Galdieria sulphuraria]|nr:RNA pseudouridylate synthase domain-containing protein 1 [Galdieria sulphuraria]
MFLSDICDPKRLPRKHQSRRPPIVDSIDFLYIDEEYLAVNKPADVRMDGDFDVTVTKLVYRKLESEKGTTRKPRFVHRLDYATSGVLIAGLMDQSASYLAKLFRERLVEKFYLALVHGWTPCKKFVMEERIANHPVDGFMMTVSADRGKSAKTDVIETFYWEETSIESSYEVSWVSDCWRCDVWSG